MVCVCSSEARGEAEGAGVINTHHAVLKKKKTTTSAFWQRRDHWMEVEGIELEGKKNACANAIQTFKLEAVRVCVCGWRRVHVKSLYGMYTTRG
jgi:hypothetical protein